MKRFLSTVAVASMLATGAFAASEAQMAAIHTYAPNVDISTLTEAQVEEMQSVAVSGKSDTEKRTMIEQIAEGSSDVTMVSPEVDEMIVQYIPAWRVAMMTPEQKAEAQAIITANSSDDDIKTRIITIVTPSTAPALTSGEEQAVKTFVPEADLSMLTDTQVANIRAAIYSDKSDSDIRSLVELALS